jgi:hypothetical protein
VEEWGFRVEDAIDVADLGSQAAHGYAAFDSWRNVLREFVVAGLPDRLLIDGGLQPTRGERFTLHAHPGIPAVLVLRTEAYRALTLRVRIDGRDLGTWSIPQAPVVWSEPLFEIPADAITSREMRVEIDLLNGVDGYPAYHYWLLQ